MLPESKFAASQYGFMSFLLTANKGTVQAINYKGKIIYETSITK
jgi:tartrate-resistant acid phosphatase type 5